MTACTFGSDISKRMLIQGIGIDTTENGYLVSVHYLRAGEKVTTDLMQSQGKTVYEALQNLTLQTGLIPSYSHNAMVVFGKECAQNGLSEVFDFFIRYHETRPTVQLFVAEDRAETLFQLKSGDWYALATQLKSFSETGGVTNKFVNSTVLEVMNQMSAEYYAFAIPELKAVDGHAQLGNTAYFRDDRLIGYLDREQTRGYLAVAHSIQNSAIVIDVQDIGTVGLTIEKTSRNVKAEIIDGVPHVQIDVTCKAYLSEINHDIRKKLSVAVYQQFEDELNRKVRSQIEQAIEQALIQDHTDIFYFATALQQQQTAYWKAHKNTWEDDMVKIQYTVNVQSSVDRVQQEATPSF